MQARALGGTCRLSGERLFDNRLADDEQNHAGATRMAVRKAAGSALVQLTVIVENRFRDISAERSVWTVGKITLDPGAPSIIPGRAELIFQFRDESIEQLEKFERELFSLVDELTMPVPVNAGLTS
jgi:N-carbamoyl-L-amino-acid hydrolase